MKNRGIKMQFPDQWSAREWPSCETSDGELLADLTKLVQGLKNRVYSIPLSESTTPYTQAEKEAMHTIFDDAFPSIEVCVSLASQAAELAQE